MSRTLAAFILAIPLGWWYALDERKMIEAASSFSHDQLSGYLHGLAVGQGHVVVGIVLMFATVGAAWAAVEGVSHLLRYATRGKLPGSTVPPERPGT